jgi:mono/diheme cytochrome c family protein
MSDELPRETMEETQDVTPPQPRPLVWAAVALGAITALVGLCILMLNLGSLTQPSVMLDLNRTPDLKHGQKIYTVSCATCHGPAGRGLPHQGAPLHNSAFVSSSTDLQVITMIKIGRTADDPKSIMKIPMPAKGGYNNLSDIDLHDVTAYIRSFGKKPEATAVSNSDQNKRGL